MCIKGKRPNKQCIILPAFEHPKEGHVNSGSRNGSKPLIGNHGIMQTGIPGQQMVKGLLNIPILLTSDPRNGPFIPDAQDAIPDTEELAARSRWRSP
jgi:hypothetical protein